MGINLDGEFGMFDGVRLRFVKRLPTAPEHDFSVKTEEDSPFETEEHITFIVEENHNGD